MTRGELIVAAPGMVIAGIVAYQTRAYRHDVRRARDVRFAPTAARRQQGSRAPVPPDPPGGAR